MDDYDNAPEMIPRKFDSPLVDSEVAELQRQLNLALKLVTKRFRIPPDLVIELDRLERRYNATANDGLILSIVEEAHRQGHQKISPASYSDTAFHVAGDALGISPKTAYNRYYELMTAVEELRPLPPLANTPKKR
jgi:hypothetical protein